MPPTSLNVQTIELTKKTIFEKLTKKKILLRIASKVYLVDGEASTLVTEIYAKKKVDIKRLITLAQKNLPRHKNLENNVTKLIQDLVEIKAIKVR
jgi:hypothetical protein